MKHISGSKAIRFLSPQLNWIMNRFNKGKQVLIREDGHWSLVKPNRLWRRKRYLKNLYRVDGYMIYKGYRLDTCELVLGHLGSDKYTPPPGCRGEWIEL